MDSIEVRRQLSLGPCMADCCLSEVAALISRLPLMAWQATFHAFPPQAMYGRLLSEVAVLAPVPLPRHAGNWRQVGREP